jgi:cellulose synthase/poly-beta-1,6-N-acetylglucosamine synthase-like glycosyltransferase
VGYPLALGVVSLLRTRRVEKADVSPSVTFIITAYNEEKRIAEKLENTLKLVYPRSKLEILVASDCSSDKTDEIVKSYGERGIQLVRASVRKGKEAAQKLAVEVANGEIFVFSDVATILTENAVSNIVKNFHDPTVGCVSSVDCFLDQDGRVSGEGAYVRYEMFLRSVSGAQWIVLCCEEGGVQREVVGRSPKRFQHCAEQYANGTSRCCRPGECRILQEHCR